MRRSSTVRRWGAAASAVGVVALVALLLTLVVRTAHGHGAGGATAGDAPLTGTTWVLTGVDSPRGAWQRSGSDTTYSFRFADDGSFTADVDGSSWVARWHRDGDTLTLTDSGFFFSQGQAGQRPVEGLLELLSGAPVHVELSGDQLQLRLADHPLQLPPPTDAASTPSETPAASGTATSSASSSASGATGTLVLTAIATDVPAPASSSTAPSIAVATTSVAPDQVRAWAEAVTCPAPASAPTAPRGDLEQFRPVAAVQCSSDSRTYPDGQWNVEITSVATDPQRLAGLVRLLDRPDEPVPPNIACAAVLVTHPDLVLVDAQGRQLRPGWPTDQCSQPMPDELAAARALDWREVRVVKRSLETPRAALDAHCDEQYKDMLYVDTSMGTPRWRPAGPVEGSGPIHVCIYEHGGSDPVAGRFVAGTTVDGSAADKLRLMLGQLPGSPALAACTATDRFAVLDGSVWIELGGCDRFLDASGEVGRADPLVAEMLTAPVTSQSTGH